MAKIKLNARDTIVEVATGTGPVTWIEVAGLTKIEFDPSEGEETADTTTYSSQGNAESEKMGKGAKLSCEGFYIADSVTGEQDAGQAAVELWHEGLGHLSLQQLRFRHQLADEWKVWNARVTVGAQGGEPNDKMSWSAEFTRSGASTTEAVTP